MRKTHAIPSVCLTAVGFAVAAHAQPPIPPHNPDAIVDLMTREGVTLLQAQWRFKDADIVEVDHRSVGVDMKPSGPPNRTHNINPHAGTADFDDREWEAIAPTTLQARRTTGRLAFGWFRLSVTVPKTVGSFETEGSTIVFEIVLDDYAEVWVDGKLPQILGQSGGPLAAGWNAPNRLVVARNARPGQNIQLAVFAANGPLSDPPENYVWIRSATLDFYRPERYSIAVKAPLEVTRLDPALDAIIPKDAVLERVADGFEFTEGPVWIPARFGGAGAKPVDEGYLLFSDPNRNVIYRLARDGEVSVYRTKSGYTGWDIAEYRQPGSNGLALDSQGRVTICEHGNRRVTRLEPNGSLTVLADRFEGKRLNSPNDLVYRSDGALYFTDPPFGLPMFHDDPRREVTHTGVYCLIDGQLKLISTDLGGPNGLAFSPNEQFLYVTNWDEKKKVVMRYAVRSDGGLEQGSVFFDMTDAPGEEALDGLKVDPDGNLLVSGPGGVWIISAEGKHLGTLRGPQLAANFAWGDSDGRTLYWTARTAVYRLRLAPPAATASIERVDPQFDLLVPKDARIETILDGFNWLEGPVWNTTESALYFSDIPRNAVYRWKEGEGVRLFMKPAGYTGDEPFAGREPGSNGLAFDAEGRLLLCEHGDRRLTRLDRDGGKTVLADHFEGKRLNSPNDLVVRPNGDVFFTDPPFGLPKSFDDPAKELNLSGVFRRGVDGRLTLLTTGVSAPNGLAFSPAGNVLYVSNADRKNPVWLAYSVSGDGMLGPGQVFASAAKWVSDHPGAPDGLKVDQHGNLFAAGPGGVYVITAEGTHLGTILTGGAASNVAWGDDGSVLYITSGQRILRVRTSTRPASSSL